MTSIIRDRYGNKIGTIDLRPGIKPPPPKPDFDPKYPPGTLITPRPPSNESET